MVSSHIISEKLKSRFDSSGISIDDSSRQEANRYCSSLRKMFLNGEEGRDLATRRKI